VSVALSGARRQQGKWLGAGVHAYLVALPRKSIAGEPAMNAVLSFFHTKLGLGVSLVLAALGGYLLWTHTGHILATLPYLFLLACPLMHFVHHGHGDKHTG
jgi:hypothetical protein